MYVYSSYLSEFTVGSRYYLDAGRLDVADWFGWSASFYAYPPVEFAF